MNQTGHESLPTFWSQVAAMDSVNLVKWSVPKMREVNSIHVPWAVRLKGRGSRCRCRAVIGSRCSSSSGAFAVFVCHCELG